MPGRDTISGTICARNSDTSGGNETYYLNLCGKGGKTDWSATYAGTTSSLGSPAVAQAQVGDKVIIQVQKTIVGQQDLDMVSFSDTSHAPAAVPSPSAPASTKAVVRPPGGNAGNRVPVMAGMS